MAYQRHAAAESHDAHPAEDVDLTDRNYNDGRLQKAIQYLIAEGGGDAIDLYITRVQAIEEHILQRFPAQGKSFDPRLHRRLHSLVRAVQDDVQVVNEEGSSLDIDSDSIVEALFKDMDDDSDTEIYSVDDPAAAPSAISDKAKITGTVASRPSTPHPIVGTKRTPFHTGVTTKYKDQVRLEDNIRTSNEDDVREKRFLYGGPNNDPEVWYKESPPSLTIGETPYMERWESAKINYDLAKSPDKFESPRNLNQISVYDSGSRYKLPENLSNDWSQKEDQYVKIQKLWPNIVAAFNGGRGSLDPNRQSKDNDYTPRMILPRVHRIYVKPFVQPTVAPTAQISEDNISTQVPEDRVFDQNDYTSSQRSRSNFSRSPRLPETNLREFDRKREAAARRDRIEMLSPRESTVLRTRSALAATPTPEIRPTSGPSVGLKLVKRKQRRPVTRPQDSSYRPPRRPSYDTDTPTTPNAPVPKAEVHDLIGANSARQKRVRLSSKPQDPSYRPPRRQSQDADSPRTPDRATLEAEINDLSYTEPGKRRHVRSHKASKDPNYEPKQSPVTPTKRLRDESLDFTGSNKKAKRSKATKKKTTSSSMHVEFAGEEPARATKATPSKATPTKSAIKKPKRISAEDRELANTMTLNRRGKTRSNKDFKPKRLRSRDEAKE